MNLKLLSLLLPTTLCGALLADTTFETGAWRVKFTADSERLEIENLQTAAPRRLCARIKEHPIPPVAQERDPPLLLHNFGGDVVEGSFFRVVIGADIDDATRICGIGVRIVLIATLGECCGG